MLVYSKQFRDYSVVARTRDDAAGEAFDKIATVLGLPYPGGPSLAKAADHGDAQRFSFPIGVADDPRSFSFSGLKTAIAREVSLLEKPLSSELVNDLAASAQQAIVSALVIKSLEAAKELAPKSFLLTGGVAANKSLRESLAKEMSALGVEFCVPPHKWCTDNAAMIGILAKMIIEQDPDKYLDWQSTVDGNLGPDTVIEIGATARWPIDELFNSANY